MTNDDRCGETRETEWGTAICFRENCDGWHMSNTPGPGQMYTWGSPRKMGEKPCGDTGKEKHDGSTYSCQMPSGHDGPHRARLDREDEFPVTWRGEEQ